MARPSLYTEALADEICARIALGDRGLARICAAEDMPGERTVYTWLKQHEEFRRGYARARELQADMMAWRALRTALTATDPVIGRLHFDALRWAASKLTPMLYG
jgi:hypothetical protein